MEIKTAIEILRQWVESDRESRSHETESDFDKFCEERNAAIETVITALGNQNE